MVRKMQEQVLVGQGRSQEGWRGIAETLYWLVLNEDPLACITSWYEWRRPT